MLGIGIRCLELQPYRHFFLFCGKKVLRCSILVSRTVFKLKVVKSVFFCSNFNAEENCLCFLAYDTMFYLFLTSILGLFPSVIYQN